MPNKHLEEWLLSVASQIDEPPQGIGFSPLGRAKFRFLKLLSQVQSSIDEICELAEDDGCTEEAIEWVSEEARKAREANTQ